MGEQGPGPLHCPSGSLQTRPSCCDNSVLCATGSSLWLGFSLRHVCSWRLTGVSRGHQGEPGRPPSRALVNYGSRPSCYGSTGHPETGPPWGQAWGQSHRSPIRAVVGPSAFTGHLRGRVSGWAPGEGPRGSSGPGFSQPPIIIMAATQMTPFRGDRPRGGAVYVATHNHPHFAFGEIEVREVK